MLVNSDFKDFEGKHPECAEVLRLQRAFENEKAFQKLISLRTIIPKKIYAMCLYMLFDNDTNEVPMDTLIEAFSGVDRKDIMFEEDLRKYEALPDEITIFRGSQDPNEEKPRISWSLKDEVAKDFCPVHMFQATISKEDVIAYFSKNGEEEEIVAVVGDNFEKIY